MTIADIASIATAIGVGIAVFQLWQTQRHAAAQFEDQLSAQYRQLMREVPIEAVLGEPMDEATYRDTLPVFYHYMDLCNEQAFLHERRRGLAGRNRDEPPQTGVRQSVGGDRVAGAGQLR